MTYSIKSKVVSVLLILMLWYSTASAWEKKYLADEFGDADYSKPCYTINCVSPEDNWIQIYIYYINGVFMLEPDYSAHYVTDATKIKAKSSSGSIYEFDFDKPSRNSYRYIISGSSDVENLINLLEQGNFTLSFYRPSNYVQDAFNYNFRIGRQGKGIRALTGRKSTKSRNPTFKGKIGGKYAITIVFDQPESIFETGGTLTGTYWYGDGRNGKMKLKGSIDHMGRISLDEFDPAGKKCGNWFVITTCEPNDKYGLSGVMTNKKDQTFNVECFQQ